MINQDVSTAKATVGSVTAATGLATYFDAISSALGIVATLLGIGLTSWMIYKEIRQERERHVKKRNEDG